MAFPLFLFLLIRQCLSAYLFAQSRTPFRGSGPGKERTGSGIFSAPGQSDPGYLFFIPVSFSFPPETGMRFAGLPNRFPFFQARAGIPGPGIAFFSFFCYISSMMSAGCADMA